MRLSEIEQEIKRLEGSEATYDTCHKLASLYTIRDHLGKDHIKIAESSRSRSEFLNAVEQAPIDGVLNILDEHMDCIKILHGREYSAIIKKIKSL